MNKLLILLAVLATGANAMPTDKLATNFVRGTYVREADMRFFSGKSLATQFTSSVWPGGIVPYLLDTASYTTAEQTTILRAMSLIAERTANCVRFTPKTAAHANWIRIQRQTGCWSYVGNIGRGEQVVSLGSGCVYVGTAVHEFMHALGYMHEQNRADRDQFVFINATNISPDALSQFDKYPAGLYYNTPYDYLSIMQYGERAFSTNGQRTIIPLIPGTPTLVDSYNKAEASIMTANDVSAVRQRYAATNPVCAAPTAATVATTTRVTTTTRPLITTAAATTVRPVATTASAICTNSDAACSQFASGVATYCANNGTTYTLNGAPFREACRLLCKNCGTAVTTTAGACVNQWFCAQFQSQAATYCSSTGTIYSVNGIPFRQACPLYCNSCGARSVQLSVQSPVELNGQ